ncbi:nucleoside triphosphate hydrolase protein [Wolfiporia cocos MD-104 SS10]|uniref:Nucleoside triphosphate hydrolase protein n=1 Tax=Wolfiporia cocos (strain MD-104) TaxID=742152 RepID=A0A2H3JD94_WOLCO|nr:nucleoside triphosphate hydrolase protein [Wolfiporia cocos MD-104 SS10]
MASKGGVKVLEGWSFQVSHVYFKSQEMHDMDAHIGDLHSSIVDREIEIVQSLLEKIIVFDKALSHISDVCAELDCLLSFAEAARGCNYVRPHMTEGNIIDIKQGRHPLQELVVDTFVPNDTFVIGGQGVGVEPVGVSDETISDSSRKESNSIIICTGANACGKSVYLKQVALIQYMAQIGSFVPAESATLGIVDKIFTRLQTRESVSRVQSAFMIDLNQVSLALRNATERSLILLDEFGKGTISADGAGLFCGVLKHLAGRGPMCPKVLAATHFQDVFSNGLISPDSVPISFVHMQILLTTDKGEVISASGIGEQTDLSNAEECDDGPRRVMPGEHITYLYRAAKGLSLDSHAALCAEVFGISRRVAKRAQYVRSTSINP